MMERKGSKSLIFQSQFLLKQSMMKKFQILWEQQCPILQLNAILQTNKVSTHLKLTFGLWE